MALLRTLISWLQLRWSSRRFRRVFNVAWVAAALVVTALGGMHFAKSGWPLSHASPWLVAVAGVLFLPLVPPLFRYSRVIWMHFDRMVDSNLESERYVDRPGDGSYSSGSR